MRELLEIFRELMDSEAFALVGVLVTVLLVFGSLWAALRLLRIREADRHAEAENRELERHAHEMNLQEEDALDQKRGR